VGVELQHLQLRMGMLSKATNKKAYLLSVLLHALPESSP
jgi:hypothetical protein